MCICVSVYVCTSTDTCRGQKRAPEIHETEDISSCEPRQWKLGPMQEQYTFLITKAISPVPAFTSLPSEQWANLNPNL